MSMMFPRGMMPMMPVQRPSNAMVPPQRALAASGPPLPRTMNDAIAEQVVGIWKASFPDATLLPVIGYPSNAKGVMTMTHTMGAAMPPLTVNGLASRSPLANNALFSSEVTDGKWINFYEIMIPDIPGRDGSPSSVQRYVNTASRLGLIDIAGDHYHWKGAQVMGYLPLAIHTQTTGDMDPAEFSRRTIAALRAAMP